MRAPIFALAFVVASLLVPTPALAECTARTDGITNCPGFPPFRTFDECNALYQAATAGAAESNEAFDEWADLAVACLTLEAAQLRAPAAAAAITRNATSAGNLYSLHVARVTDDAYRDWSANTVMITYGCLDLTLGEDIVYNASTRQATFPDEGQRCTVIGVYRPQFRLARVAQDLYRDVGARGYVRSFACYVYTYGEDVIILDDSIVFLDSGQRCQRAHI